MFINILFYTPFVHFYYVYLYIIHFFFSIHKTFIFRYKDVIEMSIFVRIYYLYYLFIIVIVVIDATYSCDKIMLTLGS